MPLLNYDDVAPQFDRRYAHNSFGGVERALKSFAGSGDARAILEIGCGTGHWLRLLGDAAPLIAGLDTSWAMLQRAHIDTNAVLVRATAMQLPFAAATFDRAFCINALHHFTDQELFLLQVRRALCPNGAFLTVGLDPHAGLDEWWIYEYFPTALEADKRRYTATSRLRELLQDSGFAVADTEMVHHVPAERPFELALEQGLLDRLSTSQLMVISDEAYHAGIERLHRERPVLRSNLRLFGTVARVR